MSTWGVQPISLLARLTSAHLTKGIGGMHFPALDSSFPSDLLLNHANDVIDGNGLLIA